MIIHEGLNSIGEAFGYEFENSFLMANVSKILGFTGAFKFGNEDNVGIVDSGN